MFTTLESSICIISTSKSLNLLFIIGIASSTVDTLA
jgi:hypothetical protein